jgi:hypothetical protein
LIQDRQHFYEALAEIDLDALREDPNFQAWQAERQGTAALKARLAASDVTIADLVAALKHDDTRWDAARHLGEMGPSAAEALPQLREAMAKANQPEEIAKAIKRIDPESPIAYLNRMEVIPAFDLVVERAVQLVPESREKVLEIINRSRLSFAPSDLAEVASKLHALHPDLRNSFVSQLLEKDPKLAEALSPRSRQQNSFTKAALARRTPFDSWVISALKESPIKAVGQWQKDVCPPFFSGLPSALSRRL